MLENQTSCRTTQLSNISISPLLNHWLLQLLLFLRQLATLYSAIACYYMVSLYFIYTWSRLNVVGIQFRWPPARDGSLQSFLLPYYGPPEGIKGRRYWLHALIGSFNRFYDPVCKHTLALDPLSPSLRCPSGLQSDSITGRTALDLLALHWGEPLLGVNQGWV